MGCSPVRGALSGALVTVTLVLGACTSPSANSTPAPTPTGAATSPVHGSSSSEPDSRQQIAALWQDVHTERLRQTYADSEPDGTPFDQLATGDTVQVLLDHIRAGRGDVPAELVDVEYWPQIDISATGNAAEIADCIIVAERPAGQSDAEPTNRSQVWTATATRTDDGWLLDSVSAGVDRCVPPDLNQQLIDAYVAYHEAWTAAWDPPDPDHPRLAETMTGQRVAEIRRQLEADRAEGIAFRDPHDPSENAVVFDLGIGTATVSDCHEAHPGYGAFDVETGERLDDVVAPVEPGQVNLTSVELARTDGGVWRVAEAGGVDDANCEPGGTEYVVAP